MGHMTATPSHFRGRAVTSDSNPKSVTKANAMAMGREGVGVLGQQRLVERFSSAKCEETDDGMIEMDLGANEAIGPLWSDEEGVAKDRDRAAVVGASDEDDGAGRTGLQIGLEVVRESETRRRTIPA